MANSIEKSLIVEALGSSGQKESVEKKKSNDGAFVRLRNFRDVDINENNNISQIQQVQVYIPFFWYTF